MCGITGFWSADHSNREGILTNMMESIVHRGPDANGNAHIDDVSLGHQRLSIIDISGGVQPMSSPNERYTLVFNGEIYNYQELRQQLVQRKCQLSTYSDTEVLLHMYMEFGRSMLDHLNGMFAFVIYDKEEKSLFVARDHFGIKPFYFYQHDNFFAFGSEIKALLQHPAIAATVNPLGLSEYLTFQLVMNEDTLFQDIHELEPASYLVVKEGKVAEQGTYWELDYTIDDSKTNEQYADELLVLLENSLSIQTRSDVPVGAYLSGGLDSSIVATLAAKNYFGDFQTFTGGFNEGPLFDETHHARAVSNHINSKHFEIYPTADDFLATFEKLVYHMDEPAAGPGLFPQYMVSKLASEHVKVVLGGQGGDEIFGGYARYAVAYLEQCIKGAIFETQEEGQHIVTLSSIIPNLPLLRQYGPMMKNQFAQGLFDPMDRRYYRMVDRSPKLDRLYDNEILAQRNEDHLFEKFSGIFNHPDTQSYFNKMTHFDQKTLLPALLHVEDRVSMAVSLESRVPLLDKRIIELSAKMPPTMKFAGGKTKYILHKATKNILPKQIVERKDKMGFPTPLNKWMAGPLREYVLDIFTSQKARERGLFKAGAIEEQLRNSTSFSRDLWGALNIEMWHRKFIDG